jgi:hypothetical protein
MFAHQELAAKEENMVVSLSHQKPKELDCDEAANECILGNLPPTTITYKDNSWPCGDVLNGLHAIIKRREGISLIVELDTGEVLK